MKQTFFAQHERSTFCKGTRFPISARRVVMFVQPGRSISWRLHQLAVQCTVCSCQKLRQFSKAKTMQFQSTKCMHASSHAACCNHFRWSSSNPRRCNMHSCNNQSINQSIIHSALQKIRSWVMSFVFLLMISSLGLLQLIIRDSPFLLYVL